MKRSRSGTRSKDGTPVSMFLVFRKGLAKDGHRPVLLTGYGGFNISLTPAFDPSNFVLLEKGGIYAVPNLRGGGEYGEAWHEAGMFERKQNVFDDFIAAAEWLIASGYSSPKRIAIEGGSNGGLLTAAVMVQRPDLFGAVVCRVPVADMLRYHRFTVGRFWISEYGSADDAAQFPFLYRYSPLHNVVDGTAYPPILITTADTDDRVSPGMAKKFAARLQAAGHGGARADSGGDESRTRRGQAAVENNRGGRRYPGVRFRAAGRRIARFSAEFSPSLPWQTRAPGRPVAMVVSPGNVAMSAPWAQPRRTDSSGDSPVSSP